MYISPIDLSHVLSHVCTQMWQPLWTLLPPRAWYDMYASIAQSRFSRSRPTILRCVEHIAIHVAARVACGSQRKEALLSLDVPGLDFRNFEDVAQSDFPQQEASNM